jgi:hypothetical protein
MRVQGPSSLRGDRARETESDHGQQPDHHRRRSGQPEAPQVAACFQAPPGVDWPHTHRLHLLGRDAGAEVCPAPGNRLAPATNLPVGPSNRVTWRSWTAVTGKAAPGTLPSVCLQAVGAGVPCSASPCCCHWSSPPACAPSPGRKLTRRSSGVGVSPALALVAQPCTGWCRAQPIRCPELSRGVAVHSGRVAYCRTLCALPIAKRACPAQANCGMITLAEAYTGGEYR